MKIFILVCIMFQFNLWGKYALSMEGNKYVLQRDFTTNPPGLLRAIPVQNRIKRSLQEQKNNLSVYGKKDDTPALKKYFEQIPDGSIDQLNAIQLINSHNGPNNLSLQEFKNKMENKYNVLIQTLKMKDIFQSISQHLDPIDIASMKLVCKDVAPAASMAELNLNNLYQSYFKKQNCDDDFIYKFKNFKINQSVQKPIDKKKLAIFDKIFKNSKNTMEEKILRFYEIRDKNKDDNIKENYDVDLWRYLNTFMPTYLEFFIFYQLNVKNNPKQFYLFISNIILKLPDTKSLIYLLNKIAPVMKKLDYENEQNLIAPIVNLFSRGIIYKEFPDGKEGEVAKLHLINNIDDFFKEIIYFTNHEILKKIHLNPYFHIRKLENIKIQFKFARDLNLELLGQFANHPDNCKLFIQQSIFKGRKTYYPLLLQSYLKKAKEDTQTYLQCFLESIKLPHYTYEDFHSFFDLTYLKENLTYLNKEEIDTEFLFFMLVKKGDDSRYNNDLFKILYFNAVVRLFAQINKPMIFYDQIKNKWGFNPKFPKNLSEQDIEKMHKFEKILTTNTPFGKYFMENMKATTDSGTISDETISMLRKDVNTYIEGHKILTQLDFNSELDFYIFDLIVKLY